MFFCSWEFRQTVKRYVKVIIFYITHIVSIWGIVPRKHPSQKTFWFNMKVVCLFAQFVLSTGPNGCLDFNRGWTNGELHWRKRGLWFVRSFLLLTVFSCILGGWGVCSAPWKHTRTVEKSISKDPANSLSVDVWCVKCTRWYYNYYPDDPCIYGIFTYVHLP